VSVSALAIKRQLTSRIAESSDFMHGVGHFVYLIQSKLAAQGR
jgi:hypothetical protein